MHALTSDNATMEGQTIWGGLVFTSDFPTDTTLPTHIKYKIRPFSEKKIEGERRNRREQITADSDWVTEVMFPSFQVPGPREPARTKGGMPCKCLIINLLWTIQKITVQKIHFLRPHCHSIFFQVDKLSGK